MVLISEVKDDGSSTADASDVVAEVNSVEGNTSPQPQAERQPTRMESFLSIAKALIFRALIIYFVMSFFRRPPADQSAQGGAGKAAGPRSAATNLFVNGSILDLYVYISESPTFADFNDSSKLAWKQVDVVYGDWEGGPTNDGIFSKNTQFETPEGVKNNGSLYMHVYVVRSGKSPDPKAGKTQYSKKHTLYRFQRLNKYKKRRYQRTQNLLTGETSATEEEIKKAETTKEEIMSHWHPNITVNLVTDHTGWTPGAVPPPVDEYVEFVNGGQQYKPILYVNDYWNLQKDYQPINDSVVFLNMSVTYQPLSLFKWQLYTAQSLRSRWTAGVFGDAMPEESDEEQDTLKEALLETSPYLLGLTIIVSLLHTVFELLAFKNDIQFWNNRDTLEGLSVRSVFFNVFQSVVVLLYVLDNETNFMVKVTCFLGLGIEVWKIFKVTDVKIDYEDRIMGFPKIKIEDKGSYVESETKQYDILAFRYLSWFLFPLLVGYAIYSLLYLEHKGWYSWVLSMIYGFLLTFGFIMMTPQLFINYKMKSVAHLPWRMLTYKFLNTIIDDIFAFVIRMPTMYRIGCFRDDIIFVIFLYQRWIYRVDPTRMNEFGFSEEMEKNARLRQQNGEPKPLTAKKDD